MEKKLYKEGATLKEAFDAFEKEILDIKANLGVEGINSSLHELYSKFNSLTPLLKKVDEMALIIEKQAKFIEQQKLINKQLFSNE
jgi:hypothetical protein